MVDKFKRDADGDVPRMKFGSYTGDDSESQAITGLGFRPRYLKINRRHTVSGQGTDTYETTEVIIDDHVDGMAITHREGATPPHASIANRIKSLDADGFTVDDDGSNEHPNKLSTEYNYMALG